VANRREIGHHALMTEALVGRVQSIRRYPVKSMLGEELDCASVNTRGLDGDRVYALIDNETQKVVSVKRPKRWGRMFELSAVTRSGTVEVCFPDGTATSIAEVALPGRLSAFLERPVSVASTPPPSATFDEVWMRDLKNDIDPFPGVSSRVEDGDEMIDNGQFMSVSGNFFNFGAIHIVTTSSTDRLRQLAPEIRFDPYRFRPNIVVETDGDGFVENGWPGKTLSIGDVRLGVLFPVPRCVMTTLSQGDLPADRQVLHTISQHNALDLGAGIFPCLGIYADVESGGEICVRDAVRIA
jgi:uncharacterized protein YcbX